MKKLQFMIKPNPDESADEFKERVYELMKNKANSIHRDKEPTVTNTYTLSFLSTHSETEPIIRKHLLPLVKDMRFLKHIDCTLDSLAINNLGGGIPYETMMTLRLELNTTVLFNALCEL